MNPRLIRRPDWKVMRRFRALELKNEGCTHEEIAEALGVTKAAVSKWMKAVREGGEDALHARSRTGAPPKLTPEELQSLPELLAQGATEYGFLEEIWTRLLVIWDCGSIHRAEEFKRLMSGKWAEWVHIEEFPAYAPDLNPDEGVWQHLKHYELRNLCCVDLDHLEVELTLAIRRMRRRPELIQSFFAQAELDP